MGFVRLLSATLSLAWKADRRGFVGAGAAALLDMLTPPVFVALTSRLVDKVAAREVDAVDFTALVCLLALAIGVSKTVTVVRANKTQLLGARTGTRAMSQFLLQLCALDIAQLDQPSVRDQMERAGTEITTRPSRMVNSALSLLVGAGVLLSLSGTLASIHVAVAILAFLSVVPSAISQRIGNQCLYEYRRTATTDERRRDYLARLLTQRTSSMELRVAGTGMAVAARHLQLSNKLVSAQDEALRRVNRVNTVGGVISGTLLAASFAVAGVAVSKGELGPGEVAAVVVSLSLLATYFSLLANALTSLQSDALFVRDYFEFLAVRPSVRTRLPVATLPSDRLSVRFLSVCFNYPGSAAQVLKDVSFTVRPGQMLAIVGENGAGKTTIVRLLLRLFDPTSGIIELGGADLQHVDSAAVQRRIGVLFQDFTRYELTVREAVQIGDHSMELGSISNDARIWAALERAGAADIVRGHASLLDAQLGVLFPGGVELSGGQWQRLALARLYYRDADIWVLDEPTAMLDPKAEAEVFDELRDRLASRVGIVISHRFSTVRSADHIIVVDDGHVVESGNHQELLALEGRYAFLFEKQAAGYR